MPKVKIDLDLEVVQEAIRVQVAPAVAEVLGRHYDIPQMIQEALLKEPAEKEKRDREHDAWHQIYIQWPPLSGKSFVEELIRSAITEAAKEYIDEERDKRSEQIKEAFRRMMRESPDRMVNAFVEMIEGADLDLELSTSLAAKERVRD